jgi:hypothetical protein
MSTKDFPITFIYDKVSYYGSVIRVQENKELGYVVDLESENFGFLAKLTLKSSATSFEDWDFVLINGAPAERCYDTEFLQAVSDSILKSDPAERKNYGLL